MAIRKFGLEELGSLDLGKAKTAFEKLVKTAVRDCEDRPADKRIRKVTLTMTLAPVPVINGTTIDCESIKSTLKTACRIPDYETQTYDFGIRSGGELVFNEDSPGNVKQATFPELDEEHVE